MTCCFFGHRDTPATIQTDLFDCVSSLVEKDNVDTFLVGNHGSFDAMAVSILRAVEVQHPHISHNVVLAYMPTAKDLSEEKTLYPEGLELVPKRFAISRRNEWMIEQSDIVVCYVQHSFGNSSKFVEKAMAMGKRVINLADSHPVWRNTN